MTEAVFFSILIVVVVSLSLYQISLLLLMMTKTLMIQGFLWFRFSWQMICPGGCFWIERENEHMGGGAGTNIPFLQKPLSPISPFFFESHFPPHETPSPLPPKSFILPVKHRAREEISPNPYLSPLSPFWFIGTQWKRFFPQRSFFTRFLQKQGL